MIERLTRCVNAAGGLALILFLLTGCATINAAVSAEQQYRQGNQLYKEGRYAAAREHAVRAWTAAPDVARYTSLLAWIDLKEGHVTQAERLFTSLAKEHDGSLAALQGLAWVEYTKKRWPEAQQWFARQVRLARQYTQRSDWHAFSATESDYILSCLSDGEYGLGLIAVRERHYAAARHHLQEALAHRNDFMGHGPILAAMKHIPR